MICISVTWSILAWPELIHLEYILTLGKCLSLLPVLTGLITIVLNVAENMKINLRNTGNTEQLGGLVLFSLLLFNFSSCSWIFFSSSMLLFRI